MTLTSLVKKFEWFDISLVKLSTAAFILMIAKLWTGILALEWYWYLALAIIFAIRPWVQMFKKEQKL